MFRSMALSNTPCLVVVVVVVVARARARRSDSLDRVVQIRLAPPRV